MALIGTVTTSNTSITSSLGYTPINAANGQMVGNLNLQGNNLQFAGSPTMWKQAVAFNGSNYDGATSKWFQTNIWQYGYTYECQIDIGTDNIGTTNKYFYLQIPTGMYFVGSMIVEGFGGGWNYGQVANYFRFHVAMVNGTVTSTQLEQNGGSSYTVTGKAFNHNTGSNMYHRVAVYCPHGRNGIAFRMWFSTAIDYWGTPNAAYTDTNPTA